MGEQAKRRYKDESFFSGVSHAEFVLKAVLEYVSYP